MADTDKMTDLFITGLINAHAVEKQALSIMTPQVSRIEHYPEVAEQLRLHIEETNQQISRLDELLAKFDSSGSRLKELGLSLTGGMAAIAHSVAGDEILKNSFANYAFEHFEIAAYKSLITMAEDISSTDSITLLNQSLGEEQRMAQWLDDNLAAVTRKYASLYVAEGSGTAKV